MCKHCNFCFCYSSFTWRSAFSLRFFFALLLLFSIYCFVLFRIIYAAELYNRCLRHTRTLFALAEIYVFVAFIYIYIFRILHSCVSNAFLFHSFILFLVLIYAQVTYLLFVTCTHNNNNRLKNWYAFSAYSHLFFR